MINDICIGVFGLVTLWLFQHEKPRQAAMVGLLAQPFWLYSAYQASLWGMLFICVVYTIMYIKGIINA